MQGYPDPRQVVRAKATGTIATGTAAAVSLNAGAAGAAKERPAIYTLTFGYAVNPTNGNILVTQGGTTLLDIDIADTTLYHWQYPEGLHDPDKDVKIVVTLADGSQNKELNVTGRCSSIS